MRLLVCLFVVLVPALSACGQEEGTKPKDAGVAEVDTAGIDTASKDSGGGADSTGVDSAASDTTAQDSTAQDTAVKDTATADSAGQDSAPADTTTPDTTTPDTTTPDTGAKDTGTPDAILVDPDTLDAGTKDAGNTDAGAPDTGAPDTGVSDTGTADTGTADTGATDSGPADTATADAGPPDPSGKLPAGLGASPCKLPGEVEVADGIELVDAFPKIGSSFGSLTFLTHPHDGTDRVVVVERKGVVWAFDNDANTTGKTKVLDISAKVSTVSEGGLLSIAFHPDFGKNGRLFLSYTSFLSGQFSSVFSEISVDPKTLVAKVATEKTLLTIKQPYYNHDGGQIFFDKQGMLVIGMGDGGSAGDPLDAGQDEKTMLGAVLRIDVDTVPAGKTYGIPADNPKKSGWLPEIWAIGVRNPWRMSVDRQTGVIWAGDVGQNKWEEVTTVPKGANLGWRILEGTHCYKPSFNCNKTGMHMPVFEYAHSLGKSITGGYVYRGKQHPSLQGMYVFGDYVSRRYWGLFQEGGAWKSKVLLQSSSVSPASFGEDRDGELYVLRLSGSPKILRVVPKKSASTAGPPEKLSQTGCFTNLKTLTPAKGVVPYRTVAPLWSDGAAKARFVVPPKAGTGHATVALPSDDQAQITWPVGTIVIKHFGLGTGAPGTTKNTPVETRFMVKGKDGWVFWTYTWNSQGTDATLELGGSSKAYPVGGSGGNQTWAQPSVADCVSCHGETQGERTLGLSAAQLNGPLDYGDGKPVNQLAAWHAGKLLVGGYKGSPDKHAAMPAQPWGNLAQLSSAQVQSHARAWLDVQCASCHKPTGSSQANIDLRVSTPLAKMGLCNVTPGHGTGGVAGAKLLVPKQTSKSVLYQRISGKPGDDWFMPHIGVTIPHTDGVALIKAWIDGLSGCP